MPVSKPTIIATVALVTAFMLASAVAHGSVDGRAIGAAPAVATN